MIRIAKSVIVVRWCVRDCTKESAACALLENKEPLEMDSTTALCGVPLSSAVATFKAVPTCVNCLRALHRLALIAENRKLKKHLTDLTKVVGVYCQSIDSVMEGPSTEKRGRTIATLSNGLEMANDAARYFGLGIDYRKDLKRDKSKGKSRKQV